MPPRTIKSVTIMNEPVFVTKEGIQEPYIPREILTHRDAYSASLHLLFKHVADFHLLMVEVIAEKYNLDADEIIQTVQNDQRMKDIILNPTLESLTYFAKEDLAKVVPVIAAPPTPTPTPPIVSEPVKPPKKRRIIVKAPVTIPSPPN
jgi:hypothetical protein